MFEHKVSTKKKDTERIQGMIKARYTMPIIVVIVLSLCCNIPTYDDRVVVR